MQQEKNDALCGVVNLYKPKGISSQKAVATVKRLLNVSRCGHTGTLDPNAQGVLPILINSATKFSELLLSEDKEYIATMQLGRTTRTLDEESENESFIPREQMTATPEELRAVLTRFTGVTEQIPPMYSAVSVGGQRLYKLAREGIEVERAGRSVTISELTLLSFDSLNYYASFRVRCSKGTYIRTLVSDIGAALGCGAVMTDLIRTEAGFFSTKTCVTFEQLEEYSPENLIIPVDCCFPSLPRAEIEPFYLTLMRNGQRVLLSKLSLSYPLDTLLRVYHTDGRFAGIGKTVSLPEGDCLELIKKL